MVNLKLATGLHNHIFNNHCDIQDTLNHLFLERPKSSHLIQNQDTHTPVVRGLLRSTILSEELLTRGVIVITPTITHFAEVGSKFCREK